MSNSRIGSAQRRGQFAFQSKALQEEAIVRRREASRQRNEFWDTTSKYFERYHSQNERFELLSSDKMVKKSEEAYRKSKLAESRRSNLMRRRHQLRAKLDAEETENLEKIKKMPIGTSKSQPSLKDVRNEYEKLKEQRMAENQKDSDEKMLQHWRINNPEYRQLQCKKRFEMVQKAWDNQRTEKERIEDAEKRQEEIRIRVEAEKALRQENDEREAQIGREKRISDWKMVITQQIELLQQRRKDEQDIKRQVAKEQEQEKKLAEMDVKRQKIEEKRKAQDLREFLSRQHRLKLLAKTSQVQKDLDQDRKLLDEMTVFLETADASGIEERDEKNQRLTWLQNVIDLQKTEEIQRQKEMEMLFSEEAEKMWKKQETVWKREEDARRHLMGDVLAGLKEQIRAKLQDKERQKEQIEVERSKIEENIDRLSKDIEKEEDVKQRKREVFIEDLDQQTEEKKAATEKGAVIDKAERFRGTNALASKLSKHLNLDEPVISDFRRRRAKWN